jgi:hypothetical protein
LYGIGVFKVFHKARVHETLGLDALGAQVLTANFSRTKAPPAAGYLI